MCHEGGFYLHKLAVCVILNVELRTHDSFPKREFSASLKPLWCLHVPLESQGIVW